VSVRGVKPEEVLSGRYRLQRLLGRGGWGLVYLARDERDGKDVALKFLEVKPDDDGDIVSRFLREGRAAATVAHAGVPAIYGIDSTPDGTPFLIMEYLEGHTLADFIRRHDKLSPEIATAVLVPLLDVLSAAHQAGIIHRDLKPSNVMLVPAQRQVKVLDFGIAKLLSQSMTRTGTPMGTPAYMAPELTFDGKVASPASDLYSVGVMLFEMLTGRIPIDARNQLELIARVGTEPAPPLATVRPGLEPKLCALVDGLLSKEPSSRIQSAAELKRRSLELSAVDAKGLWRRAGAQDFDERTELEQVQPRLIAALPPLTDPSLVGTPTDQGTPVRTEPGTPLLPPAQAPRPPRVLLGAGLALVFLVAMSASVVSLRLATTPRQDVPASSVSVTSPIPNTARPPEARQTDVARLIATGRERLAEGKFAAAYAAVSYCLSEPPCREGEVLLTEIGQEVEHKRLLDEALAALDLGDAAAANALLQQSVPNVAFLERRMALLTIPLNPEWVAHERALLLRPENAEARQFLTDAATLFEKGDFDAAQKTANLCKVDGYRCSAAARLRLRIAGEKDCLELLDAGEAALTDRRYKLTQAITLATSRCVSGTDRRQRLVARVLEATRK
jgi:serine/threonine protein kinase